jgi:hypothetical protein
VCQTCNPSWTTSAVDFFSIPTLSLYCQVKYRIWKFIIPHLFDLFYLFDICERRSELTFTVVDHPSRSLLAKYVLDLTRIVRLGNIQLMLIDALPVNSMFLSTDNGFYISETLFAQFRDLGLIPVASRFVDDDADATDPSQLQQQICGALQQIEGFKTELGVLIKDSSAQTGEEASHRSHELVEYELLLKEAEALEQEVRDQEHQEQLELAALKETCALECSILAFTALRAEISELNKNCQTKKEELLKLQFLFESRQLKLLAELNAMYPIERLESSSSSEYSIRGVELHLDSG